MAVKGLQLGRKSKAKPGNEESKKVEESLEKAPAKSKKLSAEVRPSGASEVKVSTLEKVSCSISKEGTLAQLSIQGEVVVSNQSSDTVGIQLDPGMLGKLSAYKVKPHPSLNKQSLQSACLQGKDGAKMPSQFSALKYSIVSKSEEDVPFTLTFWGTEEGATLEVEFNPLQSYFPAFGDLVIHLTAEAGVEVQSVENSDYKTEDTRVAWQIGVLDSVRSQASIEVGLSGEGLQFPLEVQFSQQSSIYDIKVQHLFCPETSSPLEDPVS